MTSPELPPAFRRQIGLTFGAEGVRWLEALPALLAEAERRWNIRLGAPFPNLSFNYVAPATAADGSAVVFKVGVVCDELITEIAATRSYNGVGCARLLAADADMGMLLLERLAPGQMLHTLDDEAEIATIAAAVMRRIWHPPPAEHLFRHVSDWIAGMAELRPAFGGGTGPFPPHVVDMAEQLFPDLLASSAPPVVLHGDLHHYNILFDQRRGWLAIDPKGILGEPAYEVGALLRNPSPQIFSAPNLVALLGRRVALLADALGMDRQRLAAWGMAQAVLSAWWSYEDHDPSDAIAAMPICVALAEIVRQG